jgi:hypothetical protein
LERGGPYLIIGDRKGIGKKINKEEGAKESVHPGYWHVVHDQSSLNEGMNVPPGTSSLTYLEAVLRANSRYRQIWIGLPIEF